MTKDWKSLVLPLN